MPRLTKKQKAAQARRRSSTRRSELLSIERLLGEDFESLKQARTALARESKPARRRKRSRKTIPQVLRGVGSHKGYIDDEGFSEDDFSEGVDYGDFDDYVDVVGIDTLYE